MADDPGDDDDLRLRKRIGVTAGYINVVVPLLLPVMAQGLPVSWAIAVTMPVVSAANLAILAHTRRFHRYVLVLILMVIILPAAVEVALGGLNGASASFLFAFLGPVYAILALGPRQAAAVFAFFLVVLVGIVLIDPFVSSQIPPQPYGMRLVFYLANIAVPLGITFAMLRYSDVRRRTAQARVDELLTNAIPSSIATRLRRGEQRIADAYPATTVLFADLVGFTPWSRRTDPALVVGFLDQLFTRFDEIAAEHHVEKIKTIGDSYMAVAGAPLPRDDHAHAAVAVGIAMLSALDSTRQPPGSQLQLRIGLASGPVVGGVIGQRRISFDLWGDTVNVAARMESSGIPGRIQVAATTYALLKGSYSFDERAPIDVKGLGTMSTYLLAGEKDARLISN